MRINGIYRTLVMVVSVLYFATGMGYAENMCYPPVTEPGVVYNDIIQTSWDMRLYSINGVSEDPEAVTTGMVGIHALKVEYRVIEAEYILSRAIGNPWHTVGKRALVFQVKGIQNKGLGQVWVHLRSPNSETIGTVPVTDHMITPPDGWNYNPSAWYTVTIPLSALSAENVYVKEIVFEGGQLADYGSGGVGTIYLDEIWWVEGLEFPLKDKTAYTAKISSVFDHVSSQSEFNCRDEWVVAYNGEVGHSNNGESEWQTDATGSSCVGEFLRGYAQDINNGDHTPFSLNGQYDTDGYDQEEGKFLFYDGHTGYDYPKVAGTSVYSVASGTVSYASGSLVVVDHQNGYTSHYEHMTNLKVNVDTKVTIDTKLGEVASGTNHLHLSIKLYDTRVDPYGWSGGFTDPSRPFAVNVPLWK